MLRQGINSEIKLKSNRKIFIFFDLILTFNLIFHDEKMINIVEIKKTVCISKSS
jgi:hypothetical protein